MGKHGRPMKRVAEAAEPVAREAGRPGILKADDAAEQLETFFDSWEANWWRDGAGKVLVSGLELLESFVLPLTAAEVKAAEEMWDQGFDPFCLFHGLDTIRAAWIQARDDLEDLIWPQRADAKVGVVRTITGKGMHPKKKKMGRPRKPGLKRKKPKPGRAPGRPSKYKSEAERQAARAKQVRRWSKKRAADRKRARWIRKAKKAGEAIGARIGERLSKSKPVQKAVKDAKKDWKKRP